MNLHICTHEMGKRGERKGSLKGDSPLVCCLRVVCLGSLLLFVFFRLYASISLLESRYLIPVSEAS